MVKSSAGGIPGRGAYPGPEEGFSVDDFTGEELREALRAVASMIGKCEKVQGKPSLGASQRTLLDSRLKALRIALALIAGALESESGKHCQ